jgi:hypothetical protein
VIKSTQELPRTSTPPFERLGAGFDLDGDAEALQKMLEQVEAAHPRLFVDALNVRVPEQRPAAEQPGKASPFSIRLTVVGYRISEP